jgi:hypothetical protein
MLLLQLRESINGALLTAMLLCIDESQVFDCSTGINQFLLLDGHSSYFELEFLEYINYKEKMGSKHRAAIWHQLLAGRRLNGTKWH